MRQLYSLLVMVCFLSCSVAFGQTTYLECGHLIDVKKGIILEKQTIVIQGDTIFEIRQGYTSGTMKNGVVINLHNAYVMPGLMDMHVHLEKEFNKKSYSERFTLNPADYAYKSVGYADVTLKAGFTTVRDLGGTGVNISLRNAINAGTIQGPRIFTCGKAISITGGHMDPTNGCSFHLMGRPGPQEGVCNGDASCREAVRQQYKNGADLIKIAATGGVLSPAKDGSGPHYREFEMKAICETAADLGMQIACHAHGDEGMQRAIRAGVTSIEHGTLMSNTTMELMKSKGTWYVPTITAGWSVHDSALIPGYYPAIIAPKALAIGPKIQGTFSKAYQKGVKIAFGTDAGVFAHGLNAKEFQYMNEAGMPMMEVIQSATIDAAKMLGMEDQLGMLEAGKLADVVAVGDNPIEHPETMMKMVFVMKDGKQIQL